MAMYAQRRWRRPHLVCFRDETCQNDLENVEIYIDAIGSDSRPFHHVATLATFYARLRLYKLKLSPKKSARDDLLGHLLSAEDVRSTDKRVAALSRMPTHKDVKHLRSLLGGLSY